MELQKGGARPRTARKGKTFNNPEDIEKERDEERGEKDDLTLKSGRFPTKFGDLVSYIFQKTGSTYYYSHPPPTIKENLKEKHCLKLKIKRETKDSLKLKIKFETRDCLKLTIKRETEDCLKSKVNHEKGMSKVEKHL